MMMENSFSPTFESFDIESSWELVDAKVNHTHYSSNRSMKRWMANRNETTTFSAFNIDRIFLNFPIANK